MRFVMGIVTATMALLSVTSKPVSSASAQAVTQTLETPKWETVSIKPCNRDPVGGARGEGPAVGSRGGFLPRSSPGRIDFPCSTVMAMAIQAYVTFADGTRSSFPMAFIDRAPSPTLNWINTDRYEVQAKAEGDPGEGMMMGPMLQTLLEDRFKLRLRHETRDMPVFELTAAKGGFKLHPLKDSCVVRDNRGDARPPLAGDGFTEVLEPGEKPTCSRMAITRRAPGDVVQVLHAQAMNLTDFAKLTVMGLGDQARPVLNNTGITGIFNIRLEFAVEESAALAPVPPPAGSSGPSIFTALQEQLGLKLESTKGPVEVLVIDSVSKPSEN